MLREGFGVSEDPEYGPLRGVGDVNGDGRDDLVLRSQNTGRWVVYLMDGTSSEFRRIHGPTRNLKYMLVGLGDFNGEGRQDLLLRHLDSGTWISYEMDPRVRGVLRRIPVTRNRAFAFEGIGDLNRDGRDDLVLRNTSTVEWIAYLIDGTRARLHRQHGLPRDAAYGYAGVGDFNGDGEGSLLLRHMETGTWVVYDDILSGSTEVEGHDPGLVEDLAWRGVRPEPQHSDDGIWTTEDGHIVLELRPGDATTENLFDLNGQSLLFTPDGLGGYTREAASLAWVEDTGETVSGGEIALPFSFDFGGEELGRVHDPAAGLAGVRWEFQGSVLGFGSAVGAHESVR